jgi:hypothetical protein
MLSGHPALSFERRQPQNVALMMRTTASPGIITRVKPLIKKNVRSNALCRLRRDLHP